MVTHIKKYTIASVRVIYHIPDYVHILNEFIWQTRDKLPDYPRIQRFLDYWDKNIDGPIKDVYIYDHDVLAGTIRHVDRRFKLN